MAAGQSIRPFKIPAQTSATIDYQASPGGAALHLAVNETGNFYFACDNSTDANVAFALANGVECTVGYDADPATNLGAKPVYAIEANDGLHTVLACVALGGLSAGDVARVALPNGAMVEVAIVASISGYVAVNFKDDVATATLRLRANLAGAADITFKTSPRFCRDIEVAA